MVFIQFLQQTDRLLRSSLDIPISGTFGPHNQQWGLVDYGTLIVTNLFYSIRGFIMIDSYAKRSLPADSIGANISVTIQ